MIDQMPAAIAGYHAHVYYDADSRARAERLRAALAEHFPEATLGRWRDEPVGPHPCPSYQVAFASPLFAALVPWLLLQRDGLDVLVHALTGDDLADHRDFALWLGRSHELDLSVLR